MSAMARELAEKTGVGESADAVWQSYRERYDRHYSESETMPSKLLPPSIPIVKSFGKNAVQLELFG